MQISEEQRDKCRAIQDRWLAIPIIQGLIRDFGEDERIENYGSPTFREVRTTVLPEWHGWFQQFLNDER